MERLMGLETEFGFRAAQDKGAAANPEPALALVNRIAREELTCLPGFHGSGIFMVSGRLYLDAGLHQEFATVECANPWDVVRYLAAGEQVLESLADKVQRQLKLGSATFSRCNVDYSGTHSTWGCHENHLHKAEPSKIPADMIPFLVSRIIMTGAGGFDPATASGCRFSLSPRAAYVNTEISDTSTSGRAIYHTKLEPLAQRGCQRLHIILGDSLCSHTGTWLKMATTALVVAMAEARLAPGDGVGLGSPVEALHAFAADPTCKATALTTRGGSITAVEIQQHYLALARRHVTAAFMPPWAPRVIEEWDGAHRQLAFDPSGLATRLDWPIKYNVFSSHIRKRGFTWDTLRQWSSFTGLLAACAEAVSTEPPGGPLTLQYFLNLHTPLKQVIAKLKPHMDARNMQWPDFTRFLKLRNELLEIDSRFGDLNPRGIFKSLDQAGVLNHRFPGVDNIEHAIQHPPATGRARVRGEAIQRLHGKEPVYACDWSTIIDVKEQMVMDLSDPWASNEQWSHKPDMFPPRERGRILQMLGHAPSDLPVDIPF